MTTMYHRRVALMKRPPLVRNSSPVISYIKPKKSVRFCDESLENVRLFLKTQMPKACQSDPTTNEPLYTYQLQLLNWPKDNKSRTTSAVRVEHLQLLNDNNTVFLIGTCQVANLAFEKHVVVHYSFDDWITVNEIEATYKESIMHSWDRFSFKIVLNTTYHNTICLAVKYTVLGREFWDNNQANDFKMSVVPKVQLHFDDDSCSSSSSSDEEEEVETKPSFQNRYDLNAAVQKPWSPPLSPTTPVDASPLWIDSSINNKNGFFTDPNQYHELIRRYCFNAQQTIYNDSIHS
ncbi:putative phosphatase regulatory subunit-domain-containing protein [Helicostylum pulchrum]|nr:putative phosphatase regulatory subunit-domain-containing protein [Helicostylum pulchrum]